MNKLRLTPTFHRFGKAVILISFLLGGCAGSPTEVRYDDTTRDYSIDKDDSANVYTHAAKSNRNYTLGQDDGVTAQYTLSKDDKAKVYTHSEDGVRYTVGQNDGVTDHYILRQGPPPGLQDGDTPAIIDQAGAAGTIPGSAEEAAGKSFVIQASDILFEFDKAIIKKAYYPILDKWVVFFLENPQVTAEVHGHTDSTGPAPYNQKLSERRAGSVMNYLVDHGVEQDRLTAKGFGERLPVAPNTTPEGRQKNRRVEMKF